jgi:anti-sigma factor RsiW
MDCKELRAIADAYLDGEVAPGTRVEIESHLAGCPDCRAELAERRRLTLRLKASLPYHEAPAGLVHRLTAGLAGGPAATQPDQAIGRRAAETPWRGLALAASFLLAMVFSGGLGYMASLPVSAGRQADLITQAVVDSHLRSLLANHLTDVASSDQHTVKPWFDGRIDIAPPVRDFAAQGFALVGGRLDYLDKRPAAALVYRHRQHSINLFVWAESSEPPGLPAVTARQGYNIRHWVANDLSFWLISDVDSEVLAQLETLLRRRS